MIKSEGYIAAFNELVTKLTEELAANEDAHRCLEISMPSDRSSEGYDGTFEWCSIDEFSEAPLNRAERRALAGNKKQNHGWKKLQRKNRWK